MSKLAAWRFIARQERPHGRDTAVHQCKLALSRLGRKIAIAAKDPGTEYNGAMSRLDAEFKTS